MGRSVWGREVGRGGVRERRGAPLACGALRPTQAQQARGERWREESVRTACERRREEPRESLDWCQGRERRRVERCEEKEKKKKMECG
eukprot:1768731-Rhodomonas_salina.1